jgi:hypothetical protein
VVAASVVVVDSSVVVVDSSVVVVAPTVVVAVVTSAVTADDDELSLLHAAVNPARASRATAAEMRRFDRGEYMVMTPSNASGVRRLGERKAF